MNTFTLPARLAALSSLSLALLAPVAAEAQNLTLVNGKPVPKARVESLMSQVLRSGQQQRTPELEQQVRDEAVLREILTQEAERRGLVQSPAYKEQMELARQSILIRELITDFQKNSPVSDAEVLAEYNKAKAQAGDKEFRARHILVDSEDEAKALIAKIKGGAAFTDVAKASSKDSGSAPQGGDLGWASPSSFVPEFGKAMAALQKGQLTEAPVQSSFGWHVILLEDTREAQLPPVEEVKGQIVQQLTQQKLAKFREDLRLKAKTDYKFSGAQ